MKLDDLEAMSPASTPAPVVRGSHRHAEFVASVESPSYVVLSDSDGDNDEERRAGAMTQSIGGNKTPALWEVNGIF